MSSSGQNAPAKAPLPASALAHSPAGSSPAGLSPLDSAPASPAPIAPSPAGSPPHGASPEASSKSPRIAKIKSWLPLGLVFLAGVVLLVAGISKQSPWPEFSELLDRACGPGRWTAGELSYDPDEKILTVESLVLSQGGLLNLPSKVVIGRLTASFSESDPEKGVLSALALQNLSTAVPAGLSTGAPLPASSDGAKGPGPKSMEISIDKISFSRFSLPGAENPPTSPATEERPLLSAARAEITGVSLSSEAANLSLRTLSFPDGFAVSSGGGISAPSASLATLSAERPGACANIGANAAAAPAAVPGVFPRASPGANLSSSVQSAELENNDEAKIALGSASFNAAKSASPPRLDIANLAISAQSRPGGYPGDQNFASDPVPVRLLLGSLEIVDPAPLSGVLPKPSIGRLESYLESLFALNPASWPMGFAVTRPFDAQRAEAKELSLLVGSGPVLMADRITADEMTTHSLSIAAQGLALAWPEELAMTEGISPKGPMPERASPGDSKEASETSQPAALAGNLLTEAGLNPLRSDLTLKSSFDPENMLLTVTIPQMALGGDLARVTVFAVISDLTPAAVESLGARTPADFLAAAADPALHYTGLSSLAVNFDDNGLFKRLASAEAARLELTPKAAASRISDALEMVLTMRLDPALSNLKDLSEAIRDFALNPYFFSVKANPDPPLSPARLLSLLPLRGPGVSEVGHTLNVTLSVNERPLTILDFRPEGYFDIDYTGEDSSLHPRP